MWLCKRDLSKECEGKYRNCTNCVLDKIRVEVESLVNANPSYWYSGDMVERESVLDIIDEYKSESEEDTDQKSIEEWTAGEESKWESGEEE